MNTTLNFSVDPVEDADIIKFFAGHKNKSLLFREVIRAHLTGTIRLIDVYQEVQQLRQEIKDIQAVAIVEDTPREELKEPADIAAVLDGLGL